MKNSRGKHTNVSSDLKSAIVKLEKHPDVKRLITGTVDNTRHKYPTGHIQFSKEIEGGICIKGYTGRGVANFIVLCYSVAGVMEYIESNFENKNKPNKKDDDGDKKKKKKKPNEILLPKIEASYEVKEIELTLSFKEQIKNLDLDLNRGVELND